MQAACHELAAPETGGPITNYRVEPAVAGLSAVLAQLEWIADCRSWISASSDGYPLGQCLLTDHLISRARAGVAGHPL